MSFDTGARGGQHDRPGDDRDQPGGQDRAAQRRWRPSPRRPRPPPRSRARRSGRPGRWARRASPAGAAAPTSRSAWPARRPRRPPPRRRPRRPSARRPARRPRAWPRAPRRCPRRPWTRPPAGRPGAGAARRAPAPARRGRRRRCVIPVPPVTVLRSGAATARHAIPATTSATAASSRRPTGSPSTRAPRKSSSRRPRASVGWTSASGASESARTCSGQPSSDSAVAAQPARVADELAEQRDAQRVARGDAARLQRLEGVAGLVAGGGGRGHRQAGDRRSAHRCDHPLMRPAIFAVGAAAATWSAPAAAAHAPALAAALRIARRVDGLPGVALTFDDGPHPGGTPAVLAALERAGARATFFLVGEQVRRDPSLAREIVAAGHAVALHGDRHRCQLRLTPADARRRPRARGGDGGRRHRAGAGALSPALRRLQPRRPGARPPPRLARPAVVALGVRLARAHDGRGDRPAREPRPERGRRHPAPRRRHLQRRGVVAADGAGAAGGAGGGRAGGRWRP